MKDIIYLDNSATTRPFDEVIEHMSDISKYTYGNPSSMHTMGIESEKLIKESRQSIANILKVNNNEIYFTSGGTESNNLAIMGYLEANKRKGNHVISTKIEHPAVLEVLKHLETKGYIVDYIGVDENGIVDLKELEEKINSNTSLISIMYVNNEIGSIQPIDEVVSIKNKINPGMCLHVDAVQAYGKINVLPKKTGIDMLTLSSHKIHGPKGVGALFVNKNVKINPIIYGGGQECHIRSGTENVSGISGFGLASQIIYENTIDNSKKMEKLNILLRLLISENFDEYRILSPKNAIPHIVSVAFEGVKAEVLLHHLEEKNIFVSTGSACSSRKNKHSHVLKALNVDNKYMEGSIRFSFSKFNSESDVITACDALKEIIPVIKIKKRQKPFKRPENVI